ncbi:unnamed protein product [Ceratitis capitata]|uniref:(Mediterranean fruit fly) hypothetical protein n=1 Tax=Ceratitis capitata TaxID=7213 RepID=A0A811UAR9_CERCA|nr:unnamed protein product [Ceratitis capitata]
MVGSVRIPTSTPYPMSRCRGIYTAVLITNGPFRSPIQKCRIPNEWFLEKLDNIKSTKPKRVHRLHHAQSAIATLPVAVGSSIWFPNFIIRNVPDTPVHSHPRSYSSESLRGIKWAGRFTEETRIFLFLHLPNSAHPNR